MALQNAANFLGNQALKGLRMGTVRYGPAIAQARAVAAEAFIRAADASRQFKRDEAVELEDPLTEEEYAALEADLVHDKYLSDDEQEDSGVTGLRCRETGVERHPRAIRVCCQTIRASREAFKTTGVESPIPVFSHWCLEVDGTFYELRENKAVPENESMISRVSDGRNTIYQEMGAESRRIKLEVTTNRVMHPSAKYFDVGTTTLDNDRIIWAASLIFRRFATSYDLFIDNCQHFTQLLAEVISGRSKRDEVRQFFDSRSVMKIPVAASWLAAPVYGCTVALHQALKPEGDGDGDGTTTSGSSAHQSVGRFLDSMENFYLHPRVYAARRRQRLF